MKWFLYNLLFGVAYAVLVPSFLLRMKRRGGYRARMGDRLGFYPAPIKAKLQSPNSPPPGPKTNDQRPTTNDQSPIWIHAVSVGEVQVAGQLMRALRRADPSVRFVFSTTSSTGWQTAEQEMARTAREGLGGADDVLVYNPLDFNGCVRRALDQIRPRAVILTETEIWPNFIRAIRRRGIPLFLVNARVSDRSAPRYRALRWFFGEVLRCFTQIYAQSDLDAARLRAAGADPATLSVTGSFKFDVAHRNPAKEAELAQWVKGHGSTTNDPLPPILLGGSTWPGEDKVLLDIYTDLVKAHPEVLLVLAPRHFEKADAVEANILSAGFRCIRRSKDQQPTPNDQRPTTNDQRPATHNHTPPVFLCDTTGEMMGLFGLATVAFVGKSLCAHGSQNMIEPCLCGKPTLVGPYTENFRPVMSDLLAADALVQVPDAAALKAAVLRFFDDAAARDAQGARAEEAVKRRRGATARCAEELLARIAAAPVPPPKRRLSRQARALAVLAALGAYAFAGWFATPFIAHGWRYLRLNPNRTYGTFLSLCAATAACPWTLPDARRATAGLMDREQPGADEFGVVRFTASRRLGALLPTLFPSARSRVIDARRLTLAEFAAALAPFRKTGYALWCVGQYDFVVLARDGAKPCDALALAEAFSARFREFAAAGVYAPADLLASYVGSDREIEPALAGCTFADRVWSKRPLRLAFRPEPQGGCGRVRAARLTPLDLPDFAWLARGEMDEHVFLSFQSRVAAVQRARREILLGLEAASGAVSTNALAHWSAAARVNKDDPLLANVADALDLEARRFLAIGNVNGAMRCYENRLVVRPTDEAAVHNFGVCLKKSGHPDMAARVFARAVEMAPRVDEHRIALVEACAASRHEDIACRQLDVLMKRHPDDPVYKMRAAQLLCRRENPAHDEARAIALAEEAVKLTRWKDRAFVAALADVYIEAGRTLLGLGLKKKMREMKFED